MFLKRMKSAGEMSKSICLLFLWLIGSAITVAQTRASSSCVLDSAKDGQTITVEGKAVQQPHDLGFQVMGCADLMILAYAGDPGTDVTSAQLEIASIPTGTTKDTFGFLHDASGKVVGTSGFGHPTRIFKYRLVVLSVADVQARKLPNPKPPT